MKNCPLAIIWGNDNVNTLGVLRQLAKTDVEVFFLINGKKNGVASKSKYLKNHKVVKGYQQGIDFLLSEFDKQTQKPFLIPCGDDAAEAIDANRDKLKDLFILMGTSTAGLLSQIDNKNFMCDLASSHGFKIPTYKKFIGRSESSWNIFPAIIKPVKINNGIREFKTLIIKDNQEFVKANKHLGKGSEYQIQELIDKQNDILVYGVRLFSHEVILAGQYIKDRWSDDGGGSHGILTSKLPEYLNPKGIEHFLKEINYYGLFSFEYGKKDDEVFFYEVNLRNDGTSHLFFQAGVNLPAMWVNQFNKDFDVNDYITKNFHKYNINEVYDIINVKRKIITKQQYKKELKEASIFHYYDSDDLKPYRSAKLKGIVDVPLRAFLKTYRPIISYMINTLFHFLHKPSI